MAIVVPNNSEIFLLKYLLNIEEVDDPVLKLFSNDITPSETTVLGDFTETTDPSYSPATLVAINWTISTVEGIAVAEYPQLTFTFSTSADIYGYFVTNNAETELLWALRSACVNSLPISGGNIFVTPRFGVRSIN
jgi:hypothetical protein